MFGVEENGRKVTDTAAPSQLVEIGDTQHMNHFVTHFYTANELFLRQRYDNEQAVMEEQMEDQVVVPSQEVAVEEEVTGGQQVPKEKIEGAIQFEHVDFERLQEVPKY